MEAGRRTASQKHLACNRRVSSAVGDFISGQSKCRCHQRLFGNMIRAMGERCYLVHFDDGQETECSTKILKVESLSASFPLDIPVPAHDEVWVISAVEEASGDSDMLEDMPAIRPEEEDAEAANEEENLSDTDSSKETGEALQIINDIHYPNEKMPGQIPMEASAIIPCQPPQGYQFE